MVPEQRVHPDRLTRELGPVEGAARQWMPVAAEKVAVVAWDMVTLP